MAHDQLSRRALALCSTRDGDTLFEQGTNRESPAVVSQEAVSPRVDGRSLVRVVVGIRSSGEAHLRPPLSLTHPVALEVRASRVPLASRASLVSPNAASQSPPSDNVEVVRNLRAEELAKVTALVAN